MVCLAAPRTSPVRPAWLRFLSISTATLLAFAAAFVFALPAAGRWLVVADPLQPARAIIVFGGHVPFRAMEAAALYKQGLAREVWLTQGTEHAEDVALERLGIDRPREHEISREVLVRSSVPEEAIRLLPEAVENTAAEVRAVASYLKSVGDGRLILITSKAHTRRVKVLWRSLAPGAPEAVVRYAPGDPFQSDRWWHNTKDAESVSHEWFGLLNAWAGFPLEPARP